MRILIHSNAPWVPTGYGRQTQILLSELRKRGHETAVSAFYGLSGDTLDTPDGPVFPAGQDGYGTDVVLGHAARFQADVIVTLMDFWKLASIADDIVQAPFVTAAWLPVDCTPLSKIDEAVLWRSGAWPVAMSRFGQTQLENAGFEPGYLPHLVTDMSPLTPAERAEARAEVGLAPEDFVVGICSANRDAIRKGFPEQFEAFASFHVKHPQARLLVHSVAQGRGGLDLVGLADAMGILPVTRFSDTYAQVSGAFDRDLLRRWYGALDVLSCCSLAEAFGVPIVEAQACGVPVVVTDGSSMTEVAGAHNRRVRGDRFWNPVHRAWWTRPDPWDIAKAYVRIADHPSRSSLATLSQMHAANYTPEKAGEHLDAFCKELESRCAG